MRISGWSSDVGSSDLSGDCLMFRANRKALLPPCKDGPCPLLIVHTADVLNVAGERRIAAACIIIQKRLPGLRAKAAGHFNRAGGKADRSEENTSELQSLMRTSYAVSCMKKNNK